VKDQAGKESHEKKQMPGEIRRGHLLFLADFD
jgi:hypothetical protein